MAADPLKQWGDPLERARRNSGEAAIKWALISIAESLRVLEEKR